MKWKFILGLILIIILIFYPSQFNFYEDLKAKQISDFIVIPLFGILILYDIYRNIKNGEKNWKKYILDFLKGIGIFSVFYFFIMRRFLSCLIIFVNCIFGEIETVKISGIITEKTDIKGSGKFIGIYELTINQNGKEFVFGSNHFTVQKYNVGEEFNAEMKKGILTIIYK